MAFVLDASVVLGWSLPDEANERADRALARVARDRAVAPTLWWFEVRNALVVNERRGRLEPATTDAILAHLAALPVALDTAAESEAVLALARRHGLSVYDAAYLELATRLEAPLATLDAALADAARGEDIALLLASD